MVQLDVEKTLSELTLQEKIALTAGNKHPIALNYQRGRKNMIMI